MDPAARLRPIYAHVDTPTYLREMWERRSFAYAMPMEEVRSTHQDTLLGNVWHLMNPLLSVAVYYIVFGMFLGADRGIPNYLLWLTVGVFAYGLTQRSVLSGATSISSNLGLMRAVRFPRALLPISTVVGRLITFGFQLVVLTGVAVLTGAGISRRLLVLPLILVIHTTLNLGGAFIAARLNDSYRDVQQVIPFAFQLLRYLSGVMFSVDRLLDNQGAHPIISRIVGLNPLVQIINMYRWVYLGTPINVARTAEAVGISALVLIFGFRFFRAHELRYGRA